MKGVVVKYQESMRSVMVWQLFSSVGAALICVLLFGQGLGVLFGGVLVTLSTWHVSRSVFSSDGNRGALLKLAGLRFALFSIFLGLGVFWFEVYPLFAVAGMVVAYVAMYVRSLLLIFKDLKGDGVD